jgi:hypothetical protein
LLPGRPGCRAARRRADGRGRNGRITSAAPVELPSRALPEQPGLIHPRGLSGRAAARALVVGFDSGRG